MAITKNIPTAMDTILRDATKTLWFAHYQKAKALDTKLSKANRKIARDKEDDLVQGKLIQTLLILTDNGTEYAEETTPFVAYWPFVERFFYQQVSKGYSVAVYTEGFTQRVQPYPDEPEMERWLALLRSDTNYRYLNAYYKGSGEKGYLNSADVVRIFPDLTAGGEPISLSKLIYLFYYRKTQEPTSILANVPGFSRIVANGTYKRARAQIETIRKQPTKFGFRQNDSTTAFFNKVESETEAWASLHYVAGKGYPQLAVATVIDDVTASLKATAVYKAYLNEGSTTVSPQTPSADERVLTQINKELDASTIEGLKKGLADIAVYSTQKSVSASAKAELAKLKPLFESKIKDLEANAAQAKSNPAANKGAHPANPAGKAANKVKQAVDKYNDDEGVTKDDTTANPVATQSPETKVNANIQVIAPEPEELTAQAATIDIFLDDPLGSKQSDPAYRTQLFNTDLNDFRRVQLVLPNNLSQENKLASFKLQNVPTATRASSADEEGIYPNYENPIPGNFQYNQFFLKGVDETRNEKFQLVDTPAQGQTLFGFGEKPEFWTIRGQVINDSLNDWATKLRLAWSNKIRISQLIDHGQFLEISIPALRILLGCYPVALTISHSDDSETLPSFAMVVFKRHESVIPEVRYRRDSAAIAMVNSILALDNRDVTLATAGQSLSPILKPATPEVVIPNTSVGPQLTQ